MRMQSATRIYLLYHELQPIRRDYSYALETAVFEQHADLFARLKAQNSPVLPEITFDDGHCSNFEFASPALLSRGLTATFFITVGWTGARNGYMGWQELRALRDAGHQIGAHGWTHTLLTHCSESDLTTELNAARLTLEDKLGSAITTMSLPGGRYNQRVLAACYQAGYTQVFTSIPRLEPNPAPALVGRLNIRNDMQLPWISGLFEPGSTSMSALERNYRIKSMAKTLLGDRLYEKIWAIANRKELDTERE
jgi:peptidoglycan/xylan/chitin deacetylase (PgdA/CDA1 family)